MSEPESIRQPEPRPNRRGAEPVSEEQIRDLLSAVTRSVRRNPRSYYPILNMVNQTRGTRTISVQTGECEGLAGAIEDLDRMLGSLSRRTLFGSPEILRVKSQVEEMVMRTAQSLTDAVVLLVKSTGADVASVRTPGLRNAVRQAQESGNQQAKAEPERKPASSQVS